MVRNEVIKMYKIFKNSEKGAIDNGVVAMLMLLITSLVFSSVAISWFLLQIYGVSVSGISLPTFTGGQSQDFLSNSYDNNVLVYGGEWQYTSGIGRKAVADNSFVVFNNVVSNNNHIYTNQYKINNTQKKDYAVILEYSQNGYSEIITKSDGFYYHVYSSVALIQAQDQFFPYPNANQIERATIDVSYNPDSVLDPALLYVVNGEQVVKILPPQLNGVQVGLTKVYYGGVHAIYSGVTIESFTSTNDRTSDGWSAFLTQAIAFISTLLQIVVWNVDPIYLPWEINLILIKTQAFGIVACAIVYVRG